MHMNGGGYMCTRVCIQSYTSIVSWKCWVLIFVYDRMYSCIYIFLYIYSQYILSMQISIIFLFAGGETNASRPYVLIFEVVSLDFVGAQPVNTLGIKPFS